MVQKKNLAIFEKGKISETDKATPTRLGEYAYLINFFLQPLR